MASRLRSTDLRGDLATVARSSLAWRRGEPAEAARETLELSRGALQDRHPVLWGWAGRAPDGTPAWLLPVAAADAAGFRPRRPADTLVRCLEAAVAAGADPARAAVADWRGFACLLVPGVDEELAEVALAEALQPHRAQLAALPGDVPVEGAAPIPLPPLRDPREGGLAALAAALAIHPLEAALALLETGLPVPAGDGYHEGLPELLRERGYAGTPAPAEDAPPSLAIADDPCPRRRHARTVLRRMLNIGKVGAGYHTEFDHFYRGAAAHERRQALEVGEALLRAGLLGEKPSVGQRHIYLRREALPEIHALIDRGETRSPALAALWTAPAPGRAPATARPAR